jgi:DNA-binding transcriptional regulator YiaG
MTKPRDIAAVVRRTRSTLELSQESFAVKIGVSGDRTIARWENGESRVPGPVVVLCDLLMKLHAAVAPPPAPKS